MNFNPETLISNPAVIALSIWALAWKGLALWRAARTNQRNWYIALLILNTFGIVEIIFLTWFVKKDRFWDKIVKKQPTKK